MISKLFAPKIKRKWQLKRKIQDFKTNTTYHALGKVNIKKSELGFSYFESGNLFCNDGKIIFNNSYKMVIKDNKLFTFFENDTIFFNINVDEFMSGKKISVKHQCAADLYQGTIQLDGDKIAVNWDVVGPNKRYNSLTEYLPRVNVR